MDGMRNFTFEISKEITKSILTNDIKSLNDNIDKSSEKRDSIDLEQNVDRTMEFYYGYLYAYESIASKIVSFHEANQQVQNLLSSNVKYKQLFNMIIDNPNYEIDIARNLKIDIDELRTLANELSKTKILSINKVGKNVIYSLSNKGTSILRNIL